MEWARSADNSALRYGMKIVSKRHNAEKNDTSNSNHIGFHFTINSIHIANLCGG